MGKLLMGVAGLGSRGLSLLKDLLLDMPNVEISAVCDDFGERAQEAQALVYARTGKKPFATRDYSALVERPDVEAVVVITPWETHIPYAIEAMRKKKPVAIEVGGASNLQECWDLIRAWEETKTPFFFLENCCFGRMELFVTNMARQGILGELVHCAGAYAHDLRGEIADGDKNHHYRLRHYRSRNCENYPTHELGPIAKLLDINAGNRMLTLSSTASKAAGLREYAKGGAFAQGDVVTTVIRCARGETILLSLDTTLPRYYSRDFTVRGTKGMFEERTNSVFIDGVHEDHFNWKPEWNNAARYQEMYEHPIWQKFLADGVTGGHGGMDGLVYGAFVDCLKRGLPMPIDVYDAAAWMAVTPLSEESVRLGGQPVAVPDFTAGRWLIQGDSMNDYAEKSC